MPNAGIMASSAVIAAGTTVLMEPFNNFTANGWTTASGPSIVTGRTGSGAQVSGVSTATWPVPTPDDTNTVGFAYKTSHINPGHDIIRLLRSGSVETRLQQSSAGALNVTRGPSTAIGTASANVITATNTWYYIELQVFSHDTAGTVTIRVNNTPVLTLTGLDTRDVGTPNQVQLWEGVGATNTYDDLYVMTGAGAPFKGDITIP